MKNVYKYIYTHAYKVYMYYRMYIFCNKTNSFGPSGFTWVSFLTWYIKKNSDHHCIIEAQWPFLFFLCCSLILQITDRSKNERTVENIIRNSKNSNISNPNMCSVLSLFEGMLPPSPIIPTSAITSEPGTYFSLKSWLQVSAASLIGPGSSLPLLLLAFGLSDVILRKTSIAHNLSKRVAVLSGTADRLRLGLYDPK